MTVISVIVGSTREGRFSEKPAKWILHHLKKRDGVDASSSSPLNTTTDLLRCSRTHRLGLSGVASQGGLLRELWLRRGRTQRPATPPNGDRASARPDSLIGPHPCRHPDGSLPGRRCRRWTGRVGGACRNADRRSLVVDCGLEGGAHQRVLTAIARRRLSFPSYFKKAPSFEVGDKCDVETGIPVQAVAIFENYRLRNDRRHPFHEPHKIHRPYTGGG